jgi:hypothetical protein
LNAAERRVWDAFEKSVQQLLGNKKSENYVEIVEELFFSCLALGCNRSWKIHFPRSYLNFFSREIGQPSLTSTVKGSIRINTEWKKRYSGKWNANLLADYCWTLVRETPTEEYKRCKTTIRVPDVTFIFR